MNLYKYKEVNKNTLSILRNCEIYFASPSQLNDPYDCRIGIKESLESAYDSSAVIRHYVDNGSSLLNLWENMDGDIENSGILSLSEQPANTIMWTHYANEHKGICLGFFFPHKWICDPEQLMIGGSIVHYHENNPFISLIHNCYKDNYENGSPPPWEDVWPQMMINGLVTKTEDWAIEQEYRVIRKEPGLVPFSPESLKEVIFGLHTSEEDRQSIEDILAMPQYAHVQKRKVIRDVLNMKIVIENE